MSIFDKLKWIEHDKVDKAYNIAIDKCSHELQTKLDEIRKLKRNRADYLTSSEDVIEKYDSNNLLIDKILTILGDK